VNNAVYVDGLEEAVEAVGWAGAPAAEASTLGAAIAASVVRAPEAAAGSTPGTLRLEYLASAARADRIVIDLFGSPGAWRARITREDGLELVRAARDLSRTSSG
jgi:hypothetical protein